MRLMDINALSKIRDLKRKQIEELTREVDEIETTLQVLEKYKRDKTKVLAVSKGACPFPESCSKRDVCTLSHCDADTCSNGYAYRFS
ncbi:hypothetical protein DesyoDRAFT_1138 [Desulfosporosinus youngiae DSM 17734]|uniref:Uncharacterized protein n=1 Tax=Desulfosporosinus youngiae DSM 17734 TaxID=768710 RepID=H5Y2P5_9FIRM|nr:hypothetical protein DesyoDRAFT_1138 [Desulfosporosinus youngiae DSM 17734]